MKKIQVIIIFLISLPNPLLASYSLDQLIQATNIFALTFCYVKRGALPKSHFAKYSRTQLVKRGIPPKIINDKQVVQAAGFLYQNMGQGNGGKGDRLNIGKTCVNDLQRVSNNEKIMGKLGTILIGD